MIKRLVPKNSAKAEFTLKPTLQWKHFPAFSMRPSVVQLQWSLTHVAWLTADLSSTWSWAYCNFLIAAQILGLGSLIPTQYSDLQDLTIMLMSFSANCVRYCCFKSPQGWASLPCGQLLCAALFNESRAKAVKSKAKTCYLRKALSAVFCNSLM